MMESEVPVRVLDLLERIAGGGSGAILNLETSDLDVNLVRFADGAGVGAHTNREVDVLLVVVQGEGAVVVDGVERPLAAGQAVLIPKGAERATRSLPDGVFAYLTVHRRRAGLWPTPHPRRGAR